MEAAAAAQEQEAAGAGRKPRSLSMAKRRAQFSEVSRDLNRIFYAFPFAVPFAPFPLPFSPGHTVEKWSPSQSPHLCCR